MNNIDPSGRGGCTVDFLGYKVPVPNSARKKPLNHAGVLTYDEQGNTRYYDYGRYGPDDSGEVRRFRVSDLEPGDDGKDSLRRGPGKGYKPYLLCLGWADEEKIIDFAERKRKKPDPYSWNPFSLNTCVTFAQDAFLSGFK
ncbi:MAG: hypothetical protein AAF481_00790 [Acidobacteriota bacterium]